MSFTVRHYTHEINMSTAWRKYDGQSNLERTLSFLVESQWLPSQTTIERAITHLQLQRTDGRTAKDDARAFRAEAERTFDDAVKDADRLPLTRTELDEFGRLSQAELQAKYWGEDRQATDFFAIRYRKASREYGYRIPPKPTPLVADDVGAVKLTADEYRSMPAQEILLRMRSSPRFKEAVYRLVAAGQILLLLGVLR
jgi:hypothetical protein